MANLTVDSHLSQSSSGWCALSKKKRTPNGDGAIADCAMLYEMSCDHEKSK